VSIALRAGIALQEACPFEGDRVGDLRMWLTADAVCVEFWRPNDLEDAAGNARPGAWTAPPDVDPERLRRVAEHVRAHPRLRAAYPGGVPKPQISILCSEGRDEWVFRDDGRGLRPAAETPPPEAALEAAADPPVRAPGP